MRVTISDDVVEVYQTYADRQGVSVEALIGQQLKRFQKLEPGKKAIVIPSALLPAFEEKLGGLPLKDGADLLDRIKALAGVSFEHIDLQLTITQRAELEHRAKRQGRPVEALVREIAQTLISDFFYSSGGGPAAEPPPAVRPGPRAASAHL